MVSVSSLASRVKLRLFRELARFSGEFGYLHRLEWIRCNYPDAFRQRRELAMAFARSSVRLTNFYYKIDNLDEAAAFCRAVGGMPAPEAMGYFQELFGDRELNEALGAKLASLPDHDPRPMFGRRIVWYALVRHAKPRVAIETGVDEGLGTSVLAAAIARNRREGAPADSRVYGFDLPGDRLGHLIPDYLRGDCELVTGDSRRTLPEFVRTRSPQFFLHDSLHSYEHERFELQCAWQAALPGAVLLSDNSHALPTLADFARENGVDYHYFGERVVGHWYAGAGAGGIRKPLAERPS